MIRHYSYSGYFSGMQINIKITVTVAVCISRQVLRITLQLQLQILFSSNQNCNGFCQHGVPFGASAESIPITAEDKSRTQQFGEKTLKRV